FFIAYEPYIATGILPQIGDKAVPEYLFKKSRFLKIIQIPVILEDPLSRHQHHPALYFEKMIMPGQQMMYIIIRPADGNTLLVEIDPVQPLIGMSHPY